MIKRINWYNQAVYEVFRPELDRRARMSPVISDNMAPTVNVGDFIIAVPADRYEGEGLYIVDGNLYRVQSSGSVKRSELWLMRDNPLYTPRDVVTYEWFCAHVLGYVTGIVRIIDPRFFEHRARALEAEA
ncbi:hypothetical protein [Taklimakanibacter albus]|uniref:Uncharacterized protein n=1 Tax=Taklimakanibacter albus TaxID=2800327 RepID=A0ACC5R169_9HYPH|nr:hypothetical protein [Aestuariivirga sp. YIM B02566]MBK1866405.1 hypothetical protein [Aestuariivirga sp. YIM B02566]